MSGSMTLEDWRKSIIENIPYIDRREHSAKLIGIALQAIHKQFGVDEANKAVRDFNLESKGWEQHVES